MTPDVMNMITGIIERLRVISEGLPEEKHQAIEEIAIELQDALDQEIDDLEAWGNCDSCNLPDISDLFDLVSK